MLLSSFLNCTNCEIITISVWYNIIKNMETKPEIMEIFRINPVHIF